MSSVGIVPGADIEQAMQNLSQVLENKQLLYVFNSSSNYVETSTSEISHSSININYNIPS